jgi:hypothetical protein
VKLKVGHLESVIEAEINSRNARFSMPDARFHDSNSDARRA